MWTAIGGASRSGRKTTPSRRYWVVVPSGVIPMPPPAAMIASQSSISRVSRTCGRSAAGHRSGRRGPGPAVDQHGALRYLVEPDGAPSGPRIVGRERAEAPLVADDGAGEVPGVGGGAQHREVAQALGQAAGGRVGADQVQFDVRVGGRPAALELAGVPAHGRPGVTDAEPGVPGGRLGDEVAGRGEDLPGLGQDVHAGRGRGDGPAGAVQQPDAENLLEGHQVARHGRLRDAEFDGGVGEGPGVDDRDQAAQVPQLQIHNQSV